MAESSLVVTHEAPSPSLSHRDGRGTSAARRRLLLLAATVAAFALRIAGIGDKSGLDWDEAFSAALASLPPTEIVRYSLEAIQEHPPLFYVVLHWWMAFAGDGQAALRMSAVVPSTLAVPLVGVAAAAAAGTPAGAVAAWALALAPLDVFYGRFARMYAVLTLYAAALLAAAAYLSRGPTAIREGTAGSIRPERIAPKVAAGAVLLTVLTHYFLAFAIVVPAGLLAARRAGWRPILWAGTAAAAFVTVWLLASPGLRDTLATRVGPRAVEPAALGGTFLTSVGAIAWPFGPVAVGAMVTVTAAAIVLWRRDVPDPFKIAALAGFFVATLGVPALSLLGIPFAPRYVVLAMPAAAALIGLSAARVPGRVLAPVGMVAALFVFWFAVLPNYGHRWGDYPEVMAALREQVQPDDAVVLNGPAQQMWYQRYGADLPQARILVRSEGPAPSQEFAAVVSGKAVRMDEAGPVLTRSASAHPRLWVVESATDYFDPQGLVVRWLDTHAYPTAVYRFETALLRLYLTDGGNRPPLQVRGVDRELLDVRLVRVGLERWTLSPGAEARLLVDAEPATGTGPRKVSVRLVSLQDQKAVWEQDRPLLAVDGRLQMRGAIVLGSDVPAGSYRLDLVVYEVNPSPLDGNPILRSSEVFRVGEVTVAPPSF